MRVRCLANTAHGLPEKYLCPEHGYTAGTQLNLTVGKVYTVYAMGVSGKGIIRYYVCEGENVTLTCPEEWPLFDIVDGRLSRYWEMVNRLERPIDDKDEEYTWHLFAFPEWTRDRMFYERLLNDGPEEIAIFEKYRKLMDNEFPGIPDPSVTDAATVLEGNWVQCPQCFDAWESRSPDGMIRCPACSALVLNPKYEDEIPPWPGKSSGA